MYPEAIEYNGEEYPINTDFRVGLECMELIDSDDVGDFERAVGVVVMLFGDEIDINDETLALAKLYLQCGKNPEEHEEQVRDMDFEQDAEFIEASFMSDYHIDLSTTSMHWWRFCALINGFTEQSVLSKVREIRNYDVEQLHDEKSKRKMKEAQERLALKPIISKEDQEVLDEFEEWLKGGVNDG